MPDKLMIDLVMEDAAPFVEEGESLLLDGFPRTLAQAQALEDVLDIDMVVNLDIPTETIVERLSDRKVYVVCVHWLINGIILVDACSILILNSLVVPPFPNFNGQKINLLKISQLDSSGIWTSILLLLQPTEGRWFG